MDIGTVLADKALLTSLSREYELLKATNADVDWQQWITARLQRAAASRVSVETPNHAASSQKQQGVQQGRRQAVSLRTPSLGRAPARSQPGRFTSSSRRSSAADASIHEGAAAQDRPPTWQAQDVTNTCVSEAKQHHPGIILRVNPGNGQQQQGQAGTQPHWVAAAKLGNALQASRVVPVLHAAADRERRLAEVTAVARQQLDLGVSETTVLAAAASREQRLQPAAQEQLQQVVKWTQEVAQQNQLLQKAMLQQQEQLTHHQGLLTTVLQQTHKEEAKTQAGQPAHQAPAAAAGLEPPAAAVVTQPVLQPAVRQLSAAGNDASPRRTAGPGHLLDQVKDSWLVKAVLQQDSTRNDNSAGAVAGPSAPDFIRIAGAAKQPPKQKHAQDQHSNPTQLQPQQKADAARALGAADAGDAAAAERRSQLKGVLRQLLSRGAVGPLPDGLAGLVAGLKGLQDSTTHQQQKEQHSQDTHKGTAASLVALLQQQQQQQRTQLSKAQLLVLQRRQAQQEQRRQQQQQQEADNNAQDDSGRPGWQSDVYVPPPSRMLRVKKAGAADVWNAPPSSKTGVPRMTGRSTGSRGSKPQAPQRKPAQHRAAGVRDAAPAGRVSTGGPAGRPRVSTAGAWRVDGGLREPQLPQQQQQQQWRWSSPPGVDTRDSSEHSRLARVEETAAQVLEAVARLEQRVQQHPQQQEQQQQLQPVTGPPGSTASGPTSLQIDPSTLSSLLAALDRVEQQEQEIRDRWFGSGDGGSSSTADGNREDPQASAVVNTNNHNDQNELVAAADIAAPADLVTAQESSSAATSDSKLWKQIQPLDGHPQDPSPVPEVLQPLQPCALSEAAIKSIKSGRQRMLRHQALLDGTAQDRGHSRGGGRWIVGSSSRSSGGRAVLQPNQVVEAVSDMLLDELLLAEAEDLDGFCDALCSQLFEDEFEEA